MTRQLTALLLALGLLGGTEAADVGDAQRAVATLAPELRHLDFLWVSATGDLNGDGLDDVALLLTGSKGPGADREERLVVLAGQPGGGFKLLAVSGEYCHPSKFYDLEVRKGMLFVHAVEHADSSRTARRSLQLRFSHKLNDFELIGQELRSESFADDTLDRTSTNFLTGQTVYTLTRAGKVLKTQRTPGKPRAMAFSGVACGAYPD